MLVFPSCNNDNIIVTYDYNKSPNTVNILSDHDIGRINLNFKVTTKEFGEKDELDENGKKIYKPRHYSSYY